MVDIILPLTIVSKYMQLAKPFMGLYQPIEKDTIEISEQSITTCLNSITSLDNEMLPLIYLDFKGLRLMLPVSNITKLKPQHDLLMIQLDGVRITPHAENPICRTPLRLDIYQLAAQANILSIPGSAVEDRQYQINIKNVCAHTTTWKNYQMTINKKMSQSYLYTMNENPALEWNKLGHGSSLERQFSTLPLLSKFDLCLIIAPPVLFKPDVTVCGSAIEVNCITDIEVTINLDQIQLISILNNELKNLFFGNFDRDKSTSTYISTSQKPLSTVGSIKQITWTKQSSDDIDVDVTKDSGIDFETSSINSTIIGKPISADTSILLPFEFLVNCGKITFVLYDIHPAVTEYEVDINEVEEDEGESQKQPLLYTMVNQPNIYFSQQHPLQKVQVSCFDITMALGDKDNQELISIPREKDFKVFMIETKNGDLHPDTGIPPSFVTMKYEKTIGKNPQFLIDVGRPTKIYFSLSRLNQIYIIKNKILSCFMKQYEIMLEQGDNVKKSSAMKSKKINWPDMNICTKQIVVSLKTDSGAEIIASLASLSGNISSLLRPDRIYSNTSVDSFIISAILNENMKVLLNPWCCNITICLLWETWLNVESIPQIQVQADSDSLYLDFGPEQMKIIKNVMEDVQLLLNELTRSSSTCKTNEKQIVLSTEQHYKDDLKAGAFQFVNGNADELPFPYQVNFIVICLFNRNNFKK